MPVQPKGFVETPFHAGEIAAQAHAGLRMAGAPIRDYMPEQHRQFFAALPFILLATAEPDGWPVATILAGRPGFITTPDASSMRIAARGGAKDPTMVMVRPGAPAGLLGIDLGTRRRNRANGVITDVDEAVGETVIAVSVHRSFGNCPQYIQARELAAEHGPRPSRSMEALARLDPAARAMVAAADTFFVASTSGGKGGGADGVDMSHRGGRPGFVRLDGDTLTVPDFRGNRYFNTLGNFLLDPRAALLFVDFGRGDLLHLSGVVEIDWNPDAARHPAGAERLWRLRITRGWRIAGALPHRWSFRDFAPTTLRTGTWSDA